jgi:hypothetical protein
MKQKLLLILALVCLLLIAAGSAGTPVISWHVISGGGSHSATGIYTLDSTIGQPYAGTLSTSATTLCSGFLCGLDGFHLYLPLAAR